MALNFPTSPVDGQTYYDSSSGNRYIYDSARSLWKYVANTAVTATVLIGTASPSSPSNGTLWWNTNLGKLFVYYTDIDTSQWVEATVGSTTVDAALMNSYVAPAYNAANNAANNVTLSYNQANTGYTQANLAYTTANLAYGAANTGYTQANLAYTTANLAYGAANTGLQNTNITIAGNVTSTGTVSDSRGDVRSSPINAQTTSYVLTTGDNGKTISTNTGVTVPNTVISTGQMFSIFNNSASSITITSAGSITMYLGGSSTTGNRTLATYGIATVLCVAANTFVITGAGLT